MIGICMLTHDQFEKKNPRADLIRFKNLGKALAKRSIDVIYITSNEKRRYEEGFYEGAKVYKIPSLTNSSLIQPFLFCLFVLPVLFRVKRAHKIDIIFVNSILTVPVAWIMKHLNRHALIQYDLMGILSEEKFIRHSNKFWYEIGKIVFSKIEDILWSRVDFITTINNQLKQLLLKRVNIPIYVVRDGVLEAILKDSPHQIREFRQDSGIVLIFVGQINHFRLDPLFEVLPSLINDLPGFQLVILGEGPHLSRYKEMARYFKIEKNIRFLGHVSHRKIFDFIAVADIAYSDDWSINGFPMKLFDYMAMGRAIIAEGTESVQELLVEQENALLYTNRAELKEKILKLAKDPILREKIGNAARKIMDQHTWEYRSKELELIYRKFIIQTKQA